MALITTVSLTFLSMITLASSDAFSKLLQSPVSPSSPTPSPLPSTSTEGSAEGSSPTNSTPRSSSDSQRPLAPQQQEEEQEEYYGLWTVSEIRSSRSHSRSSSSSSFSHSLLPTIRQREEDEDGLPTYESALATPPELMLGLLGGQGRGRKGLRVVLEGEGAPPPGYEEVVRSTPGRRGGRR